MVGTWNSSLSEGDEKTLTTVVESGPSPLFFSTKQAEYRTYFEPFPSNKKKNPTLFKEVDTETSSEKNLWGKVSNSFFLLLIYSHY